MSAGPEAADPGRRAAPGLAPRRCADRGGCDRLLARLGILPAGVAPEQRAKELVAVVYQGRRDGRRAHGGDRAASSRSGRASPCCAARSIPNSAAAHVALAMTLLCARRCSSAGPATIRDERLAGLGAIVERPAAGRARQAALLAADPLHPGRLPPRRPPDPHLLVRGFPRWNPAEARSSALRRDQRTEVRIERDQALDVGRLHAERHRAAHVGDHRDVEQFLDRAVEPDPFDEVAACCRSTMQTPHQGSPSRFFSSSCSARPAKAPSRGRETVAIA